MVMTKWLSMLLVFEIILSPALAASNPVPQPEVYRLLLADGQVIAYTEFQPHIGDYYWQAQQDVWYRVVRVEADIGWLEVTSPPPAEETTQSPVLRSATLGLVVLVFIFLAVVLRRRQ